MTTYAGYLKKLRRIDLIKIGQEVIIDNTQELAQLNRDQLNAGIRADGTPITPAYTFVTRKYKEKKGQPTDFVTLKDTGEYQSKIYPIIKGNELSFYSSDSKTEALVKKYNSKIHGLTKANMRLARTESLQPKVMRIIKNILR